MLLLKKEKRLFRLFSNICFYSNGAISLNVAAGKGYDHVSTGQEYPRGGQSEMDRDPEGQSRGYDMTSLQTVPWHIAGMLALSC